LLVAALVGLLLGLLWWFAQPNDYRSTATVLVNPLAAKQLGTGSEVIPVRTIENERLFAESSLVRTPVQVQRPDAADAITITIDERADALAFTATSDVDAQTAEQIASVWATTFVTERRKALIGNWVLTAEAIQQELDELAGAIEASRAGGADDAAINELSVRRESVTLAQPEINQQLALLRGSSAAEFLGPVEPATRAREAGLARRALLGTLLGLLAGGVLAALFGGQILGAKKPRSSEPPASQPESKPPVRAFATETSVPPAAPRSTPTDSAAVAPKPALELPSYLRDALSPDDESAPRDSATDYSEPAPEPVAPSAPTERIAPVPDVVRPPAKPPLRRVEL